MQNEARLPAFHIEGQTDFFELYEWRSGSDARRVTPLGREVAGVLPDDLAGWIGDQAVEREFEVLVPAIVAAISGQKAGYLIRVNLYARDGDTIFAPAGEILAGVGLGLEPLDALAEAYRSPAIRVVRPTVLRDVSVYLWLYETTEPGGLRRLVGASIPASLARPMETHARAEARRRELLRAVAFTTTPEQLRRIEQAQLWAELFRQRQAAVGAAARRAELERLNQRFKAAQDRFNNAYAVYQRIEREMQAHAQKKALLDALDKVVSIAKGYFESRSAGATAGAVPPINNASMAGWGEARGGSLAAAREAAAAEARTGLDGMNQAQDRLREGWQRAGVSIPDTPRIQIELN